MTTVTQDATSLKYVPFNATEWAAFVAGTGVSGTVNNFYRLSDAATPAVDVQNGANLTVQAGFNFQLPITGWARTGLNEGDSGGASAFNITDASFPDLSTTSFMYFGWLANVVASPITSPAGLLLMGPGGTEINNIVVELTAGKWVLTDGTNTGTGTINHGTGLVPFVLRYNKTASTVDLFVGGASPEKISKTFMTPAGGSKGVWLSTAYHGCPGTTYALLVALKGANAEPTDAAITKLFARANTGAVVSIAVTPASPTLLPAGTQQMTATATFQDGSTQDVTSDALTIWTSGTSAVATCSATGFVAYVSNGTSLISAAFGAQTGSTTVTCAGSITLVSIAISASSAPLAGGSVQFTAIGTYNDTHTADITTLVTWASSNPAVARIASTGIADFMFAAGTTTITATL